MCISNNPLNFEIFAWNGFPRQAYQSFQREKNKFSDFHDNYASIFCLDNSEETLRNVLSEIISLKSEIMIFCILLSFTLFENYLPNFYKLVKNVNSVRFRCEALRLLLLVSCKTNLSNSIRIAQQKMDVKHTKKQR